ncbi:MAG: peptidylprolyl isomerase [Bacillota bacterium]|jgi:peptidyl-prolyl cis-trans isomerase SurA
MMYRTAAALGAAAMLGAPLAAQAAPAGRVVRDTTIVADRVVAVVGNRPILLSQVDEEIFTRQSQAGLKPPENEDALDSLRRSVVSDIIDEELLVQEAQRDTTIKVTDEEVVQGVEQQFKNVRSRFTSEVDFNTELRKAGFETPDEYRRWTADNLRRSFYRTRLLEHLKDRGHLKPVMPTDREMREYFERTKGTMEKRPPTISFRQIIVSPRASDSARARARGLADSIVAELRKGADFATAARRFSQDPGSRESGGDLGWQRRGTFLPEFEKVEFSLKPGAISDPVETAFGYHIIQVVRVQPTETNARHILIMPAVTPADVDSARALAGRLSQALAAGASFDSIQRLHHDAAEEKEAQSVPLDKLPQMYATAIGTADSGAVLPPFELTGPDGRTKFAIVKVTERRPAGDVTYEDVKEKIRSSLGEEFAIRRLLTRLRAATYVDIRKL